MMQVSKRHAKHIGYLQIYGNIGKEDNMIIYSFSNIMTVHFNMLSVLMVDKVRSNLSSTSVFGMKRSRIRVRKSKLRQ